MTNNNADSFKWHGIPIENTDATYQMTPQSINQLVMSKLHDINGVLTDKSGRLLAEHIKSCGVCRMVVIRETKFEVGIEFYGDKDVKITYVPC